MGIFPYNTLRNTYHKMNECVYTKLNILYINK